MTLTPQVTHTPTLSPAFRAVLLRGKLHMQALGLPDPSMTMTQLLAAATAFTGRAYGVNCAECLRARRDLGAATNLPPEAW